MISVDIIEIIPENFRCNERTMMDRVPKHTRARMKAGEAVMFSSKNDKILQWVYRDIEDYTLSARVRLPRAWSKDMIVDYGRRAGLHIRGLRCLEEYERDRQKAKGRK